MFWCSKSSKKKRHLAVLTITDDIDGNTYRYVRRCLATREFRRCSGILLSINSGGGELNASYQVYTLLKKVDLPVVAFIEDYGCSGAYMIACAASKIYSTKFAETGSIGVIQSFYSKPRPSFLNVFSSGKHKDMFSRKLSRRERRLVQRDVNYCAKEFHQIVKKNRPNLTQTRRAFSGLSFMASDAMDLGLVDGIYDTEEALMYKLMNSFDVSYARYY
jgi:signal peptide peptidase SppA